MKVDKVIKAAQVFLKPRIDNIVYYGKVELIPPKPSEFIEIPRAIGRILNSWKTGSWRDLTVKDAFRNGLVGIEVFCWFYIGECIGKRSLIGYDLR